MKKDFYWIIPIIAVGGLIFLLRKKKTTAAVSPVRARATPEVPEEVSAEVPTCEEKAIALAQDQLGLPREELTVRSLLPQDLGLTTWSLNLSSANAWNSGVINTNISDNRFCCITGVSYSGSAAEQVRVKVGASTVAQFSIERVPGITTTHHIDISPILTQQNLPVSVDVYASVVSATDNVILEGITVEKRGMVLA